MYTPSNSLLLIIDLQGNLALSMDNKELLFKNTESLIKAAQEFEIPVIYTEQVPEKIGPTIPEIEGLLTGVSPIIKSSFSCYGEEEFVSALKGSGRTQIIVAGIETHVCVFQTVYDLIQQKYEVQVIQDAVSSRKAKSKEIGLQRCHQIGATISNTEMILCELLRTCKHPKFKNILNLFK